MDSLTQIVLGASVAAVVVRAAHRRRALAVGAALATLPDLDVLPLALIDDPVAVMTWHRSFSHSLLVLIPFGWLLWRLLRTRWTPVRRAPRAWLWAIQLALVTHPLLDAFTVYGTQLLWPLMPPPTMWSSVFIIDPAYTLWLLLGVVAAAFLGARRAAQRFVVAGLVLSTAYLGWSLIAKWQIERVADASLAALGLQDAPRFSVPSPLNTLLWRVVAMTPDGFVEGEYSLVADNGRPMRFRRYLSDTAALAAASKVPTVERLRWFNHGFMKATVDDDRLVLSDLRMGEEPDYSFTFVVAERRDGAWQAIPPEQRVWTVRAGDRLPLLWQRIWNPAVD
ncbi:metal-dependent hydrolase [Chiayiivirga flava]|uniref:Inner membrane protein n=1 Tax=Chiayiivirga flava TaxID=659595 RepID=A0A7W8D6F8_9GAMM|nr:inner membrane protein [Chiayiivirga flava]